MEEYLLKIKSWRLFLMLIGLPFLVAILYELVSGLFTSHHLGVLNNPLVASVAYLIYVSWNYYVAKRFSDLQTEYEKPKFLFQAFIIVLFYIVYLTIPFLTEKRLNVESSFIKFLLFLIHPISFALFFYLMYQAVKALRTVELKRQTTISDLIGDLFFFYFFPLGIWIVQPKINKLATTRENIIS